LLETEFYQTGSSQDDKFRVPDRKKIFPSGKEIQRKKINDYFWR